MHFEAVFIALLGIFAAVIIGGAIWFRATHECVRYETQLVHHPAWTQWISAGNNTSVPIVHGGYSSLEDVCQEWRELP